MNIDAIILTVCPSAYMFFCSTKNLQKEWNTLAI